MLNRKKLHGKVIAAGLTLGEVAKRLRINPATMTRKMAGETEFTRAELQRLRSMLKLTAEEFDAIFFADELTETQDEEET